MKEIIAGSHVEFDVSITLDGFNSKAVTLRGIVRYANNVNKTDTVQYFNPITLKSEKRDFEYSELKPTAI